MQTFSGVTLDITSHGNLVQHHTSEAIEGGKIQSLLNVFVLLNVLQLLGTVWLLRKDQKTRNLSADDGTAAEYEPLAGEGTGDEAELVASSEESLAGEPDGISCREDGVVAGDVDSSVGRGSWHSSSSRDSSARVQLSMPKRWEDKDTRWDMMKRGRIFAVLAGVFIVCTWVVFITSAVFELKSRTPS
jgi:hypothetical protein